MTALNEPIAATATNPLLRLVGVSKCYPGVTALEGVDIDIRRGEIHALLGENGAGKSTLVGVVNGTVTPDEGELRLEGEPVRLRGPNDARSRGISVVPQDLLFVPELSIGRNILLGLEHGARMRRDHLSPAEFEKVHEAMELVGADFSPGIRAGELTTPELRLAQVARALIDTGDLVVLDEPTAVLSESDAEHLLDKLMAMRDAGKAIIYVSHRVAEVVRLADRATVLRDGAVVGRFEENLDRDQIIAAMGRDDARSTARVEWNLTRPDLRDEVGPPAVAVRSVQVSAHAEPVNLEIARGEITAIVGVQGSGHGRLASVIAGVEAPLSGWVEIDGEKMPADSVRAAIAKGVVLLPADRRREGIIAPLSISANLGISRRIRAAARRFGLRSLRTETTVAREYIEKLDIRTPGPYALTGNLSGGNQQKVVLARAMESSPTVMVAVEPTQGIDIGTKEQIRRLLAELAHELKCTVIIATSEFDDVLGLADRVHVMHLGSLAVSLDGKGVRYNNILAHALG